MVYGTCLSIFSHLLCIVYSQSSTKTGPRQQSAPPPPPPPRARTSPPSSTSSSSSPFNFDFNSNDDLNSAGESLLDILGDMFSDLNRNGGAGMARDFALLLEGLEGNAMVMLKTLAGFVSLSFYHDCMSSYILIGARAGTGQVY